MTRLLLVIKINNFILQSRASHEYLFSPSTHIFLSQKMLYPYVIFPTEVEIIRFKIITKNLNNEIQMTLLLWSKCSLIYYKFSLLVIFITVFGITLHSINLFILYFSFFKYRMCMFTPNTKFC